MVETLYDPQQGCAEKEIQKIIVYKRPIHNTKVKRLLIQRHDNKIEEIPLNQLDDFLNQQTGRNNNQRILTHDAEQYILTNFAHICVLQEGKYKNIGKGILEEVPGYITRAGTSHVQTDTGELLHIGLTSSHSRIKQSLVDIAQRKKMDAIHIMAEYARELTVFPGFSYRKLDFSQTCIYGTITSLFQHVGKYAFEVKPGIKPSDAIHSVYMLYAEPLIIECSIALQLVLLKTVLSVLGDDAFNALFTTKAMRIESKITEQSSCICWIDRLHKKEQHIENPETMLSNALPGDILYIKNVAQYKIKHPIGDSQGMNVVYLGKNSNGEHEFGGLFSQKRTRTYDEIVDLMIEDYNKRPFTTESTQS